MDQIELDDFRRLVRELVKKYKKDHPEEAEDLDIYPPRLYGTPDDGLLKIGKSIYVLKNRKIEKEFESPSRGTEWLP